MSVTVRFVEVLVVHQQGVPGLLDIDDELGAVVRGDDRGDARLRMVLLGVDRHASGRDDLERLERGAVHDHVLRRPVGAGDGVPVLPALELGGLDRARLEPDLDRGDGLRRVHPEIDQVDLGVAADHVEIAAGRRDPRDVHRVAGVQHVDDLVRAAVDQGDLAGVAQSHREQIVDIEVVLRRVGALLDRHVHGPGLAHLLQAELGRRPWVVQQVARHQVDLALGQLARGAPVRHAGGRAVVDERLQVVVAELAREVGRERLARGALPEHAMAAGAALEVDLVGLRELGLGQARHAGLLAGRLDRRLFEHVQARLVAVLRLGLVLFELFLRGLLLSLPDLSERKDACRGERQAERGVTHESLPRVVHLFLAAAPVDRLDRGQGST